MEIKYKRLYKTAQKSLWDINNYSSNNNLVGSNKSGHNFILLKDFWQNIDKIFWENEINKTIIFFPDPWWKKDRQKKHRLLQENFLNKLYAITKKSWKVFFKTDHKEYFDFVLEEIKKTNWKISLKTYDYEKDNLRNAYETTEFEQIFRWKKLKFFLQGRNWIGGFKSTALFILLIFSKNETQNLYKKLDTVGAWYGDTTSLGVCYFGY